MFSDVLCRCALSSGGHRSVSLWGALAPFELKLRHPVCSTDVFGCCCQALCDGSSQSRHPFALASSRRCQCLLEALELNWLILSAFYPQVENQNATGSQLSGSQHREPELRQYKTATFDQKTFDVMGGGVWLETI